MRLLGWINRAAVLAILTTVMAAATSGGHCASSPDPDLNPVDLYRRSLDAAKTVSYTGRQFIMSFGDEGQSSSFVTVITHRAPDEYCIVYRAPRTYAGRTIIESIRDQWTLYAWSTIGLIHAVVPNLSMTRSDKLRLLLQSYKITRAAQPRIIAGRKTFEVIVQRHGSATASGRYWIDPYTWFDPANRSHPWRRINGEGLVFLRHKD